MIPHDAIALDFGHLRLTGRSFLPARSESTQSGPAVLFVHGWTSSQDVNDVALAAELTHDGFACLTFDLAGHGVSDGDRNHFTIDDFLAQTVSFYDWLAARPEVDRTRIAVVGTSFGGYLGLLLTAARPVSSVSLRVPANYPDEVATGQFSDYLLSGHGRFFCSQSLPFDATRSLRALRAFRGDVQIIEAGADDRIDPQTIANYIAAVRPPATLEYSVIHGAPHKMYESPKAAVELRQRTRAWLIARSALYAADAREAALHAQAAVMKRHEPVLKPQLQLDHLHLPLGSCGNVPLKAFHGRARLSNTCPCGVSTALRPSMTSTATPNASCKRATA